jgi:hypothetical protein
MIDLLRLQRGGDRACVVAFHPNVRMSPCLNEHRSPMTGLFVSTGRLAWTMDSSRKADAAAGDIRFRETAGVVSGRGQSVSITLAPPGGVRTRMLGLFAEKHPFEDAATHAVDALIAADVIVLTFPKINGGWAYA